MAKVKTKQINFTLLYGVVYKKKKNRELESRMILDEISNSLTRASNESLFSKNNENNLLFTKGHF